MLIKYDDNPITKRLAEKFGEKLEQIKDNGPRAQLKVQYFKMEYIRVVLKNYTYINIWCLCTYNGCELTEKVL